MLSLNGLSDPAVATIISRPAIEAVKTLRGYPGRMFPARDRRGNRFPNRDRAAVFAEPKVPFWGRIVMLAATDVRTPTACVTTSCHPWNREIPREGQRSLLQEG
jgi:hypothetical protein